MRRQGLASTTTERSGGVRAYDFSARQARVLVLVLEHSGGVHAGLVSKVSRHCTLRDQLASMLKD
jgi:hypothetical protein